MVWSLIMGESTIVWLRPPDEKPHGSRNAKKDAKYLLWRNRHQLLPVYLASGWYALAAVVGDPVGIVSATLVCSVLVLIYGDKVKLDRVPERRYAALAGTAAAGWYGWSCSAGTGPPDFGEVAVLAILTVLVSAPWWNHRKIRGSIPVEFHAGMSARERQTRRNEVAALLLDWSALSSAGQLSNSKVLGIRFTPVSVDIKIRFRRGAAVEDFTVRRLAKLESAFACRRGASRVEPVESNAQQAIIRLMIVDPHAEPIPLPDTDDMIIGLFETGGDVEFELINSLIAGETGAGKSGILNAIICKLMRNPKIALLGIDLKPGGIELRPYSDVMAELAINPRQARRVMRIFQDEMQRRGDLMGDQGIREWPVTEEDPFMVLIIDEAFELKRHKLESEAEDITALSRAFGGCVLVATQHPTDRALSMIIKANCPQNIGAKTRGDSADRVIFGENATKDGWRPSKIPPNRPGSFMIRNRKNIRPLLARAFNITDKDRDREVQRWASRRTSLGGSESNAQTSYPLPGTTTPDVVDAVVVEQLVDTGSPILDAIRAGANTAALIVERTKISRSWVFVRLRELEADGVIRPGSKRGVWVVVGDEHQSSPG
jgi:hypothetical protein